MGNAHISLVSDRVCSAEKIVFGVTRQTFILLLFLFQLAAVPAYSEPSVPTIDLPLQGLRVELNAAGDNWERIYATGRESVEFPDRRGILTAQKKAELRAQAAIVRWLNQDLTAEQVLEDIEAENQVATSQATSTGGAISKETTRVIASSLSERIRSMSGSKLRGVSVLEAGYDDKLDEAWVKVGISRKTMAIASEVSGDMNRGQSPHASGSSAAGVKTQSTEIRRAPPLP
jgi:hypothetical protein